jgi:hypothetical protein
VKTGEHRSYSIRGRDKGFSLPLLACVDHSVSRLVRQEALPLGKAVVA